MTNLQVLFEDWRYVPGYEGRYIISNKGRLKSLDKNIRSRFKTRRHKGVEIPQKITNSGYGQFWLWKNSETEMFLVHRLVLTVFVGNPPQGYVAMHLNDIKTDNRLCNLKWGTQSENVQDSHYKGLAKPVNKRPIVAIHLTANTIKFFDCISDAKKQLRVKNIHKVLSGERPHCKNYTFKYL